MTTPASSEITRLLVAWCDGDEQALERLAPLVQAELRRLAKRVDKTTAVLKVSPGAVMREWSLAQAWLYRELRSSEQPSGGQDEQ